MRGMNRWWKWALGLAVAVAPWLAGLSFPFLYDDVGMIAENDFLAEPSNWVQVASGRTLLDPGVVNGRRPAVLASYFLDRAWHGLEPTGWRVTSLLLHLACAGMAMGLLRRVGGRDFVVVGAGLLFAVHPALVEAVHAPGFRADVLCLFFMLASLHGFLSVRDRGVLGLAWGGACAALALLSKETALALPLLLGGMMALFPGAFPAGRRAAVGTWAACAGIAGGFFALWLALPTEMQALGVAWNGESLRFPETAYSVPALWTRTVRFMAAPWPLNVAPDFEPVASARSGRLWVGAGWMALCGWGAWGLRRKQPLAALGVVWMGAFFLPVSNLLPLLHPVADRYLYPIAPGFATLAAWGLFHLPRRARGAALAGLVAVYAGLLIARVEEWRSAEALWTAAQGRNPNSATAATWLGLLREEAGDVDGARAWYGKAIAANSNDVSGWINWGILEGKSGNMAESERLLRRATELRPESEKAWLNLAASLELQGRMEEAAEAVGRARERGKR